MLHELRDYFGASMNEEKVSLPLPDWHGCTTTAIPETYLGTCAASPNHRPHYSTYPERSCGFYSPAGREVLAAVELLEADPHSRRPEDAF